MTSGLINSLSGKSKAEKEQDNGAKQDGSGSSNISTKVEHYMNQSMVNDHGRASESNPVTLDNLHSWEVQLLSDAKNQLALSALTKGDVKQIIQKRSAVIKDSVHVFSDKVETEGSPVTDQKSSGRCWIFAAMNVLRTFVQKKYNLEEFQFSQSYLFFYDKLEKANYFLQQIIETADQDLDSRLVQTLLAEPVSDGGQWDMIVNLIEKYGVVPHTVYPDAFNASNSGTLNYVVIHKLREHALILRQAISDGYSTESVASIKEELVKEVHGILTLSLGNPPKPDGEIVWDYYDKNSKFNTVTITPQKLYKEYVTFDVAEHFSLIHDPRNPYKELYTVDRLGNVVGGKGIEYVNAEVDVLKQAAIKSIKNNEPVFFGSDVGKFSNKEGIMDTTAWNYELAFNTSLGLSKEERLRTGESQMTHAMVLTGVNIVDGKPTKWRVENSWGDTAGQKGYYVMSDEWFDEYVYQVVTSSKYVSKEYSDILKSKKYTTLPRWDPLGALA